MLHVSLELWDIVFRQIDKQVHLNDNKSSIYSSIYSRYCLEIWNEINDADK